ncbi:MAG: hypothetical protein HY918_05675 [Candidatus Doudnabacteria bacterium]|nr:hypothetical protein [Candidatus Doudnabacteria bacterium]
MDQITPPEIPQPKMPGKLSTKSVVLIITLVVVFIASCVAGFSWYQKKQNVKTDSLQNGMTRVVVTDNPFPEPIAYTQATDTVPNGGGEVLSPLTNLFNCTTTTTSAKKNSGEIVWQKPQLISGGEIFTSGNPFYGKPNFYKLGHFAAGNYAGADLFLVDELCEGPCTDNFYYLVKKDDKLAILQKESVSQFTPQGESVPGVGVDNNYSISDKVYPNSINGPQGQVLDLVSQQRSFKAFCADNKIKAFTDPALGDVYTDPVDKIIPGTIPNYGFYVQSPDGSQVDYKFSLGFAGADNVPQLTWNNNVKNTDEYIYTDHTRCGSYNYVSVITADTFNFDSDLTVAGVTIDGQTVFEFKNPNHQFLKDFYDNTYYPANGDEKMPYAQFVKSHPVFFWKDGFGRLVKFQKSTLLPVAECGKPVIYLYPTKPQEVFVKVSPVGGMSKSDPEYGNGWQVFAEPDGKLTEKISGLNYPYLFWEGRGGIYESPKKGFVVKQSDVSKFLDDKLAMFGLNRKETVDFKEFWLPRMQGSPYYFISFMGNEVMDMLAPLDVSPKPDTVIRVLMDFTPLDKKITVDEYKIHTPQRKGFVVVEWGGVLRK